MTRSKIFKDAVRRFAAPSLLALVVACSSNGTDGGSGGSVSSQGGSAAANGGSASGGAASGGAASGGAASGGAASGGVRADGGATNSNGGTQSSGRGGAATAGTGSGGAGSSQGGASATSGGAATGGVSAGGSANAGGPARGGASSGGGSSAAGGNSTAGAGSFDPCPSNEPCKILPLGDSITWGINYGGGYRIKLFAKTSADNKSVTFVGYDTANPPNAAALDKLGAAKSMWVGKHEGHSGWVIQQDDDLVTGKSTESNDGVNYKGKKVVADFNPHIVLIHLGTNDMYKGPNGAPDRLGTLIDHVVADAPNALVVVASIIPFPSGASAVTTFNKAVPGVVQQRTAAGKHVVYVDMFAALTNSDLGTDMVHPNEGGYEKMATVWYNAIKAYLH